MGTCVFFAHFFYRGLALGNVLAGAFNVLLNFGNIEHGFPKQAYT